jgi:hypothetical protein
VNKIAPVLFSFLRVCRSTLNHRRSPAFFELIPVFSTKGLAPWLDIEADGLDGLVEKALKTGRLRTADPKTSPAGIATEVDFSVGIGSYSAVVLSALSGARVLLVDFERLDHGPDFQPTLLLHTLGPNRCFFMSLIP